MFCGNLSRELKQTSTRNQFDLFFYKWSHWNYLLEFLGRACFFRAQRNLALSAIVLRWWATTARQLAFARDGCWCCCWIDSRTWPPRILHRYAKLPSPTWPTRLQVGRIAGATLIIATQQTQFEALELTNISCIQKYMKNKFNEYLRHGQKS